MDALTLALIEEACRDLEGRVRRTPVEESPILSRLAGVPVFLKLECLQRTGSFKMRGALFALSRLAELLEGRRIVTCSAGNHGWAVAEAARLTSSSIRIFVPATIDRAKLQGMQDLGADVVVTSAPGYDGALKEAVEAAESAGEYYLSAYDDPLIMAANGGTLAAEVLEQAPDARAFLLPVGGGGLAAGFSMLAAERLGDVQLFGCQLEASPALKLSLDSGKAVTELPPIETVAGGLEGGLGEATFEVLKNRLSGVALVREAEIHDAVRWLLRNHRYLVEPSGAVGVAACLSGRLPPLEGPAVVVLSGRNVAFETLRELVASSSLG